MANRSLNSSDLTCLICTGHNVNIWKDARCVISLGDENHTMQCTLSYTTFRQADSMFSPLLMIDMRLIIILHIRTLSVHFGI